MMTSANPNYLASVRAVRDNDYKGNLDYYPTPPHAITPLIRHLQERGYPLARRRCHEPAAGGGHMLDVLAGHFKEVFGTDIKDYGRGFPIFDYVSDHCLRQLERDLMWIATGGEDCLKVEDAVYGCELDEHGYPVVQGWHYPDWVITNPPFKIAEKFIHRALHHAIEGVAMFCRLQFIESIGRYERLFSKNPPTTVLAFSERVKTWRGRLATPEDSGGAIAYAWFVWEKRYSDVPTQLRWIAPLGDRSNEPLLPGINNHG